MLLRRPTPLNSVSFLFFQNYSDTMKKEEYCKSERIRFQINIELDAVAAALFVAAIATRFYRLEEPEYIV